MVIGGTYLHSARPLGRGIMLLGGAVSYLVALLHHVILLHGLRNAKERIIYVVSSAFDEAETRLVSSFCGRNLEFVGCRGLQRISTLGQSANARSCG